MIGRIQTTPKKYHHVKEMRGLQITITQRQADAIYCVEFDGNLASAAASDILTDLAQAASIYGGQIGSIAASRSAMLDACGSSGSASLGYFSGAAGFYSDFGSTTRPSSGAYGASTRAYLMSLKRGATNFSTSRNRTHSASTATTAGRALRQVSESPN